MQRTRCVIIGLGRIGEELLRRLSRDIDLTCVDPDPASETLVRQLRGDKVRFVRGDATSRLVLEDARVAEADVVVVTPTAERVTLEVARVLHDHFTVRRVVALGITPSGTSALENLGVEVEGVFPLSANALRNRIEQRSRAAHGIGLGREEVLEVEVHPRSRLANKRLDFITPRRWRVGLIYRNRALIVPRGSTVLRGGDRVVVLGDPGVLRTVVEILTLRFERFPLEYGTGLTAYLTGQEQRGFFDELAYVRDAFPLERLNLVLGSGAQAVRAQLELRWTEAGLAGAAEVIELSGAPLPALGRFMAGSAARRGLLFLDRRSFVGGRGRWSGARAKRRLQDLGQRVLSPVLLAAGTFPYARLAIPGVEGVDVEHVLEAVFEAQPYLHQESSVLLVRPNPHLATEDDHTRFDELRGAVSDLSLVYRSSVDAVLLHGNPVRAVLGAVGEYNLLVVDSGGWKRRGPLGDLFDPDVVWHLVRSAAVSTLLVPTEEEAL